jgi:hypothetical protein
MKAPGCAVQRGSAEVMWSTGLNTSVLRQLDEEGVGLLGRVGAMTDVQFQFSDAQDLGLSEVEHLRVGPPDARQRAAMLMSEPAPCRDLRGAGLPRVYQSSDRHGVQTGAVLMAELDEGVSDFGGVEDPTPNRASRVASPRVVLEPGHPRRTGEAGRRSKATAMAARVLYCHGTPGCGVEIDLVFSGAEVARRPSAVDCT